MLLKSINQSITNKALLIEQIYINKNYSKIQKCYRTLSAGVVEYINCISAEG